jgi:aminoglycoside phosphotransferase family enzyme/predicted kinase
MSEDDARDALPAYVRGLLEPTAYPAPPAEVRLVQTHISYVFLAGDVVYKTKKPVDFGFIEQLSVETRHNFCDAEVRLNRRLAPDVYLGVVPVLQRADGTFAVEPADGAGEVVEWAVKMRRLPDDVTLDRLIAEHREPADILARLVGAIVPFHEQAEVVPNDPAFAGAVAEEAWWTREYGEAAGFIGSTWTPEDAAATKAFADATIAREAALFDERLAEGRIIDGHGDMQAKHVYVLGPEPKDLVVVDCVEFTDWFQLRYADVNNDVAFLAMDLEARGRPEMGDEFAGRYLAATADETLAVLQPLHRTFRAFVRGKVESIGAHAMEIPAEVRAGLAASAAAYFRLAADYRTRVAAPCVVVMCGASGTGKSLVGATLATRIGAAYVSSDAVRKHLAGIPLHASGAEAFREGMYSPEMTAHVYEEMGRRAAQHVALGRPVVLDATHAQSAHRRAAAEVARAAGVPALIVELRLTDDAALARIVNREHDPLRTSDATVDVYRRQVESFEPVSASEGTHLTLDASQPAAALAWEIAEALPKRG